MIPSSRFKVLLETMTLVERRPAWWANQPRDQVGRWTREQMGGSASQAYPGGTESHEHPNAYRTQKHVDEVMGDRNHGIRAEADKDGNTRIRHEADPTGGMKVDGSSILDTIVAMGAYVDFLSALAAKSAMWMGSKLGQAAGDLKDALDMWTGR